MHVRVHNIYTASARARRAESGAMASFNDSAGRLKIYAKLFLTGKHKGSLGQKAHRVSP